MTEGRDGPLMFRTVGVGEEASSDSEPLSSLGGTLIMISVSRTRSDGKKSRRSQTTIAPSDLTLHAELTVR